MVSAVIEANSYAGTGPSASSWWMPSATGSGNHRSRSSRPISPITKGVRLMSDSYGRISVSLMKLSGESKEGQLALVPQEPKCVACSASRSLTRP